MAASKTLDWLDLAAQRRRLPGTGFHEPALTREMLRLAGSGEEPPFPVSGKTRLTHARSSPLDSQTGYASLPGGPVGWAGTLGGSGLAVSSHSLHPQEAIELVRFLVRAQIQSSEQEAATQSAAEAVDMPSLQDHETSLPLPVLQSERRRPPALRGCRTSL